MPTWLLSKEFWLAMLAAALFTAGWWVNGWRWEAKMAAAQQRAGWTGQHLQGTANQAEMNYQDRLREDHGYQTQRALRYQTIMFSAREALAGCRVDAGLLRVLNDAARATTAGVPAEPVPAPQSAETDPGAAADSTCAAVIDTYYWNLEHVVRPNEVQLEELTRFYRRIRQEYCLKTGAC